MTFLVSFYYRIDFMPNNMKRDLRPITETINK
jgi:hypothetical protein